MPDRIFDFEKDFAGSLRCIPMAVRLKLDLVGIKLSLRQWSRLDRDQRGRLLEVPCGGAADRHTIGAMIEEWVTATGGTIDRIDPADSANWSNTNTVPEVVVLQAKGEDVSAPSLSQWRALTDQQRFALIKLTRPGHENKNFVPAMREFGLFLAD
ncbi:nitrate reductase associated protein [Devosia sp. 2618]|uniref:nitrate reductase associated protein n=1 Tax=Devosia sp. 2618 TaxID=3156454 RepID=UPI00339AC2BD